MRSADGLRPPAIELIRDPDSGIEYVPPLTAEDDARLIELALKLHMAHSIACGHGMKLFDDPEVGDSAVTFVMLNEHQDRLSVASPVERFLQDHTKRALIINIGI